MAGRLTHIRREDIFSNMMAQNSTMMTGILKECSLLKQLVVLMGECHQRILYVPRELNVSSSAEDICNRSQGAKRGS